MGFFFFCIHMLCIVVGEWEVAYKDEGTWYK